MNFFKTSAPETVDTILGAFTQAIDRLNDLSVAESAASIELRRKAEELQLEADAKSAEAERARVMSDKLAELFTA